MASNNIDARQSSFNHASRDWHQTHTTNNYTVRINFSLFGSRQLEPRHHRHHSSSGTISRRTSVPQTLSPRNPSITSQSQCSSHSICVIDASLDLIIQIADRLIDRRDSHHHFDELRLQLKSLHQALTLTKLAIQAYAGRPLGQSMAYMITMEVQRCEITLQELITSITGTRQGLYPTSIGYLWRLVWWNRWDGDEHAALRNRLSPGQIWFGEFLLALHSCVLLVFFEMTIH